MFENDIDSKLGVCCADGHEHKDNQFTPRANGSPRKLNLGNMARGQTCVGDIARRQIFRFVEVFPRKGF